ncbi:MAG: response regulator [Thermodesulfobacteriota bacterium]
MKTFDSTILVVEDNQMMRKMLESMLKGLGYRNCQTAADGAQAWDLIQAGGIDIVLCDYLMPTMTGLELLRHIRQTRQFCDMPFIMITGADKRSDLMRSIQAEVDYYLIKPPNISQLAELLKNAVARQRNPSEYDQHMSQGKYHFLNAELDEALRHFEMASQARLDSALPYYYQGLTHLQLNNEKKAELNFKKSLIIEDQFISSLLALADIYQARGDFASLEGCLARVMTVLPDAFDIQIGLARACTRSGKMDRAAMHLASAQQLAKNNAEQIQEVLDCYIEAGLLEEADLLFGRKVQDEDNEKTILFLNRLGVRARKMKDFEKAKFYYSSCLKLDPQNKNVNYNLATLFFLQKDYVAAESYLKKILRSHTEFPEAQELMDAIRARRAGTPTGPEE